MDMDILTAIIQRVKAHHNTELTDSEVRFEVYENETWCVMLLRPDSAHMLYGGDDFTELPALLSSLK